VWAGERGKEWGDERETEWGGDDRPCMDRRRSSPAPEKSGRVRLPMPTHPVGQATDRAGNGEDVPDVPTAGNGEVGRGRQDAQVLQGGMIGPFIAAEREWDPGGSTARLGPLKLGGVSSMGGQLQSASRTSPARWSHQLLGGSSTVSPAPLATTPLPTLSAGQLTESGEFVKCMHCGVLVHHQLSPHKCGE
jgi:hypothetical protein